MTHLKIKIILNLLLILLSGSYVTCFAGDYYSKHSVGWHWYDDPREEKVKQSVKNVKKNDPDYVIADARKEMTTALNTVIAEPTQEHMEKYIALQEKLNDRAEKVADLWQQVLLKNPSLNYSLNHPTNNVALQVYHEQQSQEMENSIKDFANKTGLFFFYRSTCSYCHRFAPILKNFAEHYGITVVPITLDGISLPEFPYSKTDSGQAAQFHVTVTPSLFAVNPYTQKAFPVAYGLTSETELRENIYKIMTKYEGNK